MSEQELRPIVVGFDGSEPSHRALAWATRQGQVTGAPVEVLTTWQWPTNYGYAMAFETTYRPDDVAREMVAEVVRKAASGCSRCRSSALPSRRTCAGPS